MVTKRNLKSCGKSPTQFWLKTLVRSIFFHWSRIERVWVLPVFSPILASLKIRRENKSHQYFYCVSKQKSSIQWICSKFVELWHGHNYFWPPWLWMLLEAKNVIGSANFGTLTQPLNSTFGSSHSDSSAYQKKCSPINEISSSFQPPYLEF